MSSLKTDDTVPCTYCNGLGEISILKTPVPCQPCNGSGYVRAEEKRSEWNREVKQVTSEDRLSSVLNVFIFGVLISLILLVISFVAFAGESRAYVWLCCCFPVLLVTVSAAVAVGILWIKRIRNSSGNS